MSKKLLPMHLNEEQTAIFQCGLQQGITAGMALQDKLDKQTYAELCGLAEHMHKKFFYKTSPNWGLCDSTPGVISQIDNMLMGLTLKVEYFHVCTQCNAPDRITSHPLEKCTHCGRLTEGVERE